MRSPFLALFLVGVTLTASPAAIARTWHVPADIATIPDAADSATRGDTVLVAPGIHVMNMFDSIVVKDGVVITSEAGPWATRIRKPADDGSVFHVADAGSETEISGFTIVVHQPPYFPSFYHDVTCLNASPRISRLVTAWGGVENYGQSVVCEGRSTPEISHCTFMTDEGIVSFGGEPTAHHNIFRCYDAYQCWGGSIESACNNFWYEPFCAVGPGDFVEDPRFCETDTFRPSLDASSPCVHGYGCGLIGALDVECGATPAEAVTWGTVKSKFR